MKPQRFKISNEDSFAPEEGRRENEGKNLSQAEKAPVAVRSSTVGKEEINH